ncbi:MAG: shikimate kinase [Candidatus Omnitrophica bacterium 4484_70.1]|nr:MAG: shikimate kinase [Candidatus Omnitrophica bacterium 4484_70.1]
MDKKNIYLVGFMGTGKTTVGKILAKKLKKEFIEMDEEIEKREGKKIVDIFRLFGEPYFRKVEKEVLKEIASCFNLVVSCGGGVVVDRENLRILKESGIVICLKAKPSIIYERTKKTEERPLLNVPKPLKKIKELLAKRAPFYAKADYSVDTSTLTPEEVSEKVIEILKNEGSSSF